MPFFDPLLIESSGIAFIRENKIDESLRRLLPNAHITKGSYSYPSRAELRDLAWNHMDQNHRPLIHSTYASAARIFIQDRAAFSLTRFGRWPLVIPVFDGYYKDNGFYQIICLFGAIMVVNIIECNKSDSGTRMDIAWTIASHRMFRFLHPALNRRLRRLNEIQNQEDDEIRNRRVLLRDAGYHFKTDVPNFINSNIVENNLVFPPLRETNSINLEDLPEGRTVRVDLSDRAYILRRDSGSVEIWPGICLHEGAALELAHLSQGTVVCPWHGLSFRARRLDVKNPSTVLCGARLDLVAGKIVLHSVS